MAVDILDLVRRSKGPVSTSDVARALRVTRQAAHRRLRALAQEGKLIARGAGRASRWELARSAHTFRFSTKGLAEDRVWEEIVRDVPAISALGDDARRIASYAFTELLNNAIDHSGSKTVDIRTFDVRDGLGFEIVDRGAGAFETVRAKLGLATALDALGEISKGKTTTMPARHSGEGIFFTSKAVRRFDLDANGVRWTIDNARNDFTVSKGEAKRGTIARVELARHPARTLRSVFDEYTVDHEFARTRTVVRLFAFGTEFVSRSEARRMLTGLERFREVIFDFAHVVSVGQGFADEVFRVWADQHEKIVVRVENANDEVAFMLRRAGSPV